MAKKNSSIDVHEFDCGIYPRLLWVAITSDSIDGYTMRVDDDGNVKDVPLNPVSSTANGETTPVYNEKEQVGGILLRFPSRKYMTYKTIAHESVHAANMIFDYCGVDLDARNDEAYAYLVGWIAECCEKVKNYREGGKNETDIDKAL